MNGAGTSCETTAAAADRLGSIGEVWNATPVYVRRGAVALMVALIAGLYVRVFRGLFVDWWEDPNYSHGLLVPLFVAYVLWRERSRYREIVLCPSNIGLGIVAAAIAMLLAGSVGSDPLTTRISLILLLAGLVLFFAGRGALRAIEFPLGCLALMIPVPTILLNQIAFPLQLLASRLATALLQALGYAVLREGNILYVGNASIEVAQACSGIRSLFSILALALAYGYIVKSGRWVRIGLAVTMIPVTVAANAVRVVSAGAVAYSLGQERVEGFLHTFSGLLVFGTAVCLMLIVHRLLVAVDTLGHRTGFALSAGKGHDQA